MSIGYIYCITNKVNGKRYVGQTIRDYKTRWNEHINDLNKNKHCNEHLQYAWNNYGEENFEFTLLETIECTQEELDELEKQYIREWNLLNHYYGYNIAEGGNGGYLMAGKTEEEIKEIRAKQSEANKQRWNNMTQEEKNQAVEHLKYEYRTEEQKKEHSRKVTEANIKFWSTISDERKKEIAEKISKAHMGMKPSEETRRKLSEQRKGKPSTFKGKKHTEESKKKTSQTLKANPPMLGKHLTEEQKEKISIKAKERYQDITNHPMYGRKMSEESKEKNRLRMKEAWKDPNSIYNSEEFRKKLSERPKGENHPMYGKHLTEEHRRKISKANKGKKVSEETKRKMSEAQSGEKNGMYGKTHSEETRKKISEQIALRGGMKGKNNPCYGRGKKVKCIELNMIFDNAERAIEYLGKKCASVIRDCCKGEYEKAYGYHWQWVED